MEFKVGDVVTPVQNFIDITKDKHYAVLHVSGQVVHFRDDSGELNGLTHEYFELVRRAGEPEKPASILAEAAKIAGGDRSEAYGHPLDNHRRIAGLWNAYIEARKPGPLTPQDVARMMILLKVARDLHAPRRDNRVDICGYAECLDLMEGNGNGPA